MSGRCLWYGDDIRPQWCAASQVAQLRNRPPHSLPFPSSPRSTPTTKRLVARFALVVLSLPAQLMAEPWRLPRATTDHVD